MLSLKDQEMRLLLTCSITVFLFHCGAAWCTEKAFQPGQPHFPGSSQTVVADFTTHAVPRTHVGVYSLMELGTMFVGTAVERVRFEKAR